MRPTPSKFNSIPAGIIIGIVLPVLGFIFFTQLYQFLESNNAATEDGLTFGFRERTVALLAICLNLIPFIIFNRKFYIQGMRGIIFPTVLMAIAWVIIYGNKLF